MKVFHKCLYLATEKCFEVMSDDGVLCTTEEQLFSQQPVLSVYQFLKKHRHLNILITSSRHKAARRIPLQVSL
jgi:hypothetical protein